MKDKTTSVWPSWLAQAKPLVPVLVFDDLNDVVPVAQALVDGGITLLEVTLRTPIGLDAIELIKNRVEGAIVGAGTVTTATQLEAAVKRGAEYIVSPGITDELLQSAQTWGGPYLPGVATASEVMQAMTAGFYYQKLFPAAVVGGLSMLKALQGPFPEVQFCPTGGIGQDSYPDYLRLSNVFAVGGSWLTPKALIVKKDWQALFNLAASS